MVKFNLNDFILFESEMLEEDTAYHGSPYDFKEFDTAFMGKGEGAQAHGWGLYFSLNPDTVYRRYTGRITNRRRDAWTIITYKGLTFEKGSQGFAIFKRLMEYGKDDAIKALVDSVPYYEKKNNPEVMNQLKSFEKIIKGLNEDELSEIKMSAGQNYTVDIPDTKTFLNEWKKYNSQPANVKQALKDIWTENGWGAVPKDSTGEDLYKYIAKNLPNSNGRYNDKGASLELYKHGIPGIFYNGYSDGNCVVIFNGKDVKILEKAYANEENYIPMDPTNVEFLSEDDIDGMKDVSQELQDALIEKRPELFKYVRNPSEESIFKMLQKDPTYFKHIDGNSQTPKMQDIAVKSDIGLLKYCKNPSKELVQWCLNKDSSTIDILTSYRPYEDNSYQFTKEDFITSIKSDNPDYILTMITTQAWLGFGSDNNEIIESADFINTIAKDSDIRFTILDRIKQNRNGEYFIICRIVRPNIQDKIDPEFLSEIVGTTLNKPKMNNEYEALKAIQKCLPYITEKYKAQVIMRNPKYAKYMDSIPENVQMKMIKKNPFNIRYINNPSKTVVDTALQMNPDVKDYMR